MCGSHSYGGINKQKDVEKIATPAIATSTQELGSTLENKLIEKFLDNPGQRTHFEKLHNAQEKLKYINNLITKHYADEIANAYQNGDTTWAKEIEKEMMSFFGVASQMIFWNTTSPEA